MAWLLMTQGGPLIQDVLGEPSRATSAFTPFAVSLAAAFLTHAGLRWMLRRWRLHLSTSEHSASLVFLGLLVAFALSGHWLEVLSPTGEHSVLTQAAIVGGAWMGADLRRRIPL